MAHNRLQKISYLLQSHPWLFENVFAIVSCRHEEEMYRLIITNYEERQKEMMLENQVLRESLSNMQKELVDLLNREGDKGLVSTASFLIPCRLNPPPP